MFSRLVKMTLGMASTLMVSASLFASIGGDVFISNITNTSGSILLSRSLLEFHSDGTLIVSDSDQEGEPAFAPFGIQHGYWVADHTSVEGSSGSEHHETVIKIKTVDFNYPKYFTTNHPTGFPGLSQGIVISTATLTKVSHNTYEGDIFLSFFPLQADINDPSQGAGPFLNSHIVLVKITKPE